MSDDIVVLHKRAEVIMDTIYPTLRNYPKYEHGRLCNTLLNTCMELISLLGLAEHVKPKRLRDLQVKKKTPITSPNQSSNRIS